MFWGSSCGDCKGNVHPPNINIICMYKGTCIFHLSIHIYIYICIYTGLPVWGPHQRPPRSQSEAPMPTAQHRKWVKFVASELTRTWTPNGPEIGHLFGHFSLLILLEAHVPSKSFTFWLIFLKSLNLPNRRSEWDPQSKKKRKRHQNKQPQIQRAPEIEE